jgi:hypothetical protein
MALIYAPEGPPGGIQANFYNIPGKIVAILSNGF